MAGKATRFQVIPGGRLKRWRNKQNQCSCVGEKHFDIGYHPDQIRARIITAELPFDGEMSWEAIRAMIRHDPEPPFKVGHGRKRRSVQFFTRNNDLVAACA